MAKNALFILAKSFYWRNTISYLSDNKILNPVGFVAPTITEKWILEDYPNADFFPSMEMVRGSIKYPSMNKGLSSCTLEKLSSAIYFSIRMMDRMDHRGVFTLTERFILFSKLASFWYGYLKEKALEIVVFESSPHFASDYILYTVAKKLGLTTLIQQDCFAVGRTYFCTSIGELPKKLESEYQDLLNKTSEELKLIRIEQENQLGTEELLKSLKPNKIPDYEYMRRQRRSMPFLSQMKKISVKMLKNLGYKLRTKIVTITNTNEGIPVVFDYQKISGEPIFYYKLRPIKNAVMQILEAFMLKSREKHYTSISTVIIPNGPFVYFPLSYQPERTTLPEAGWFSELENVICILLSSLPERWKLVVKEHPSQFKLGGHAVVGRNKEFYEYLLRMEEAGLVLLDYRVSAENIISKSQVVAVVTGTAGWEALKYGKPVVSFGTPWYSGCNGVFRVDNPDQCKKKMTDFAHSRNSYVPFEEVEAYGLAINRCTIPGRLHQHQIEDSAETYKELCLPRKK